ncbi:hypothetical protein [Devosia sp. 2618]|uniref:hypothetical protein n=1 Tax=Devosia sp. 2618 TaxID=3156454 RepID=UPI00339549FD
MNILKTSFAIGVLCAATAVPVMAQGAGGPNGTFVDSFGTSFSFKLCGDSGTDLCGTLTSLKGKSATPENLAFVGKQVMQAKQTAPGQWKGSLSAGGISADATVTQAGPDTMNIQGCRAVILCQTLSYNRS